ncbi:MAG: amidohydrolase family protein [Armatimonadota bacterium]|nr:amidohydrolase family protein [Armatimonadota bacterium]
MTMSLQEHALTGTPLDDVYVVDAHAHMGPYFAFNIGDEGSAEAMVGAMDRLGIDVSIASPHIALTCDYRKGNRRVAEAAQRFPGRIVPFVVVNPNYPLAEIEAEIEHWHRSTGIVAFKFHSGLHSATCLDDGYTPAYEYADEHGVPILSHSWNGEGGREAVIETLSERYPNITFINAHSSSGWDVIDDACDLADQFDRVYLDLTGSLLVYGGLERMVERVGAERILWGTDSPFIDPRPALGRMLCAQVSDEDKRKMLGLNAKRLFGL